MKDFVTDKFVPRTLDHQILSRKSKSDSSRIAHHIQYQKYNRPENSFHPFHQMKLLFLTNSAYTVSFCTKATSDSSLKIKSNIDKFREAEIEAD